MVIAKKVISGQVGDALPDIAANRQVCPTCPEITFGSQSKGDLIAPRDFFAMRFEAVPGGGSIVAHEY